MKLKFDNVSYAAVLPATLQLVRFVRAAMRFDIDKMVVALFNLATVFTNIEEMYDEAKIASMAIEIEELVLELLEPDTADTDSPALTAN